MTDEFKPCPFCGDYNFKFNHGGPGVKVECGTCAASGPCWLPTVKRALKEWNTRADLAAPREPEMAEAARLKRVEAAAAEVMRLLDKCGQRIVPHLFDSDDNPGQRLREALAGEDEE